MRIGIEAQRIFRPHKHGMDRVAIKLIEHLQILDKTNQYFVFVKDGPDKACIKETGNFKIILVEGKTYFDWEQIYLPRAVKENDVEILHCTSNTAPLFPNAKLVLTLHDVIFLERNWLEIFGGSLYQKLGNIYRKLLIPKIVKRCKSIITVSKTELKVISGRLKSIQNKISAVYNGVDNNFLNSLPKSDDEIKTKYNLPKNFIFYIGNTEPRKNTKGVLEAFNIYLKKYPESNLYLAMAGYKEELVKKHLEKINAPDLIDRIKITGFIDDLDLPSVYSKARMFLFPTFKEGFGIPPLEAMSRGCPVIASNLSAVPEVCGDAALYINPYNLDEIAEAINNLDKDNNKRHDLRIKGLERSRQFTWNKMAKSVLKIYNQAA